MTIYVKDIKQLCYVLSDFHTLGSVVSDQLSRTRGFTFVPPQGQLFSVDTNQCMQHTHTQNVHQF